MGNQLEQACDGRGAHRQSDVHVAGSQRVVEIGSADSEDQVFEGETGQSCDSEDAQHRRMSAQTDGHDEDDEHERAGISDIGGGAPDTADGAGRVDRCVQERWSERLRERTGVAPAAEPCKEEHDG